MFINEYLTEMNEELAYMTRILKKEGKVCSIWTRNCKIYIKTNGSPELAKYTILPNRLIVADSTEAKKRTLYFIMKCHLNSCAYVTTLLFISCINLHHALCF